MNQWEIEGAADWAYENGENLYKGALVLHNLMRWANNNSDGWHMWPKPARAAAKLIQLLEDKQRDYREDGVVSRAGETGIVEFTDATDAQLKAAFAPIKAFLTRQGVTHSEVGL